MNFWRFEPQTPPPSLKGDDVLTVQTTQEDGATPATPASPIGASSGYELVSPATDQLIQNKDKELETLTRSW